MPAFAAAERLVELVSLQKPTEVALIAESAPASRRRAAESLASILRPYGTACRVVVPPGGQTSFAAWRRAGASVGAIVERMEAAEVLPAVRTKFGRKVAQCRRRQP